MNKTSKRLYAALIILVNLAALGIIILISNRFLEPHVMSSSLPSWAAQLIRYGVYVLVLALANAYFLVRWIRNLLKTPVWRHVRPYLGWTLLAPAFMLLEVFMDLLQPQFMGKIIDVGVANGDTHYIVTRAIMMGIVAMLGVVGGVGNMIFSTKAFMILPSSSFMKSPLSACSLNSSSQSRIAAYRFSAVRSCFLCSSSSFS